MLSQTPTRRLALGVSAGLITASLLLLAQPALAVDTSMRSPAEIQARYQQLQPTYTGSPYAVAPTLAPPYSAGSLASGELQDGLDSVNYVRYLAGLPDDVTLDPRLNDDAQHGAVLLAVGQFAHSQPQPSDMPTAFYDIANATTSVSNIGMGYSDLWDFNLACMQDEDPVNLSSLGHRRWLLDPAMQNTGMGLAGTTGDTYAVDESRVSAVTYDSIDWPCAGAFPAEMLDSYTPWSITLNPDVYSWTPGTADKTVTLRRIGDGKTWTFTGADTDPNGPYFNLNTEGYGVPDCFIFRPDPNSVGGYQVGDAFQVTLSGGITAKATGAAATISYVTQLISQGQQGAPIATNTSLSAPSSVKVRTTLKLSGRVSFSASGKVIISKRHYVASAWKSAGSSRVTLSHGRFGYKFKPAARGIWHFVATYSGRGGNRAYRASRSRVKSVRVR